VYDFSVLRYIEYCVRVWVGGCLEVVGWLVGWLVGLLVCWFVGWLVGGIKRQLFMKLVAKDS
jgi:hypothetical protein